MAFSDYSTTPANNTSIEGINISEGCPAANVNNALRQLAADGASLNATVAAINTSGLMPKSGGAFSGAITRSGGGSYPYWASSSLNASTSGAMYVQTAATALPASPAEGTIVFQY
jgi:hypothetical protein